MEGMTEPLSPINNLATMSHAEAIACVQMLFKRLESWDSLEKIILQQQEEITQLKARLSKDSHNSSKPPSSDGLARRAKSLRIKTGAKAGRQVGHVGSTLKKSTRIDHVIVHQLPGQCGICDHSFTGMGSSEEAETRQVIDLPALRFEITEHRVLRVQCRCGDMNSNKPIIGQPYRIEMQDGTVLRGSTDEFGKTQQITTADPESVKVYWEALEPEPSLTAPYTHESC